MKTDWSNYTITYDGTDYGVYYRDGINLVACEAYVPNSPTPTYPATITSTGDLVTSSDDDWNTAIEYGKASFVGSAPGELGVDCYRVPIVVSGKNLFKLSNVSFVNYSATGTTLGDGINIKNNTAIDYANSAFLLYLLPNTQYTLKPNSVTVRTGGAFISPRQSDDSGITGSTAGSSSNDYTCKFIVPSNGIIKLKFYSTTETSTTGDVDYTDIQLETGAVATDYESYISPITYNIYLDAPLRYGDTLDENGLLTRARGVETGVTGATHSPTGAKADGTYLCTQDVTGSMVGGEITFTEAVTGATVEFDLATSTAENITMPSAIPTFEGTTLIQLDTTTQPSVLEAEYWATEDIA